MLTVKSGKWSSGDNLGTTSSSIIGMAYYIIPSTDTDEGSPYLAAKRKANCTIERKIKSSFVLSVDEDLKPTIVDDKNLITENIEFEGDQDGTITEDEITTIRKRMRRLRAVSNLSGLLDLPEGVSFDEIVNYMKDEIE